MTKNCWLKTDEAINAAHYRFSQTRFSHCFVMRLANTQSISCAACLALKKARTVKTACTREQAIFSRYLF
ncbi:MAG: hypothetical protein IJS31_06195, partial [Oscillospiraceae bacterium]|nr:hypothetical protein [Oscillospiraceae bacterium]